MVFIVGASSLRNTLNGLSYQEKKLLLGSHYHWGGLSFNVRTLERSKLLQNLLNVGGDLCKKSNLVIWHDVINNTITPFKQTKACHVSELIDILLQYKDRFAAIVYIKRFGAPLCLEDLRSTGIVVIDAFKQLISHRNRKSHNLINEFFKLHLFVVAEARILFALWRKRDKLELFGPRKFCAKRLIKKRKPSQKKRKKQQTSRSFVCGEARGWTKLLIN